MEPGAPSGMAELQTADGPSRRPNSRTSGCFFLAPFYYLNWESRVCIGVQAEKVTGLSVAEGKDHAELHINLQLAPCVCVQEGTH